MRGLLIYQLLLILTWCCTTPLVPTLILGPHLLVWLAAPRRWLYGKWVRWLPGRVHRRPLSGVRLGCLRRLPVIAPEGGSWVATRFKLNINNCSDTFILLTWQKSNSKYARWKASIHFSKTLFLPQLVHLWPSNVYFSETARPFWPVPQEVKSSWLLTGTASGNDTWTRDRAIDDNDNSMFITAYQPRSWLQVTASAKKWSRTY